MSWLSRVRNGIPFLPKRQSAENLWHKCKRCGTMVFVKEWEENYNVCPRCDFHDRIGPTKRFEQLFDAAEYELLPAPQVREDPLRFKDTKRYTERLKAARAANGERDALVNARGRIDGHKVILGVQDFAFMGGSMGIAVGAAFVARSEEHTSELQSQSNLVCRLLLEKKNIENALALLCGAEAATVVNNCAAALVLIVQHFPRNKTAIVISLG